MKKEYQVAAYYFPNWHSDSDYASFHGKGWTEWEILKTARPHFEGHLQPKIPVWGYEDESDPAVMAKKIDAASDHAVHAFIFDWYWKSDHSVMSAALEEGFLKAENNQKLKFALMWANHDRLLMRPNRRVEPQPACLDCRLDRPSWDRAVTYMLEKYFSHPSYWRIDGKLYFQIYEIHTLIRSLGGIAQTRDAIDFLRARVREAGLGEMKIDCISYGVEELGQDAEAILTSLGIDGTTTYVWYHHASPDTLPAVEYASIREKWRSLYGEVASMTKLPYIPNVTVGWDPSPRCVQSEIFEVGDYPYTEIYIHNTPEEFERSLRECKHFLDTQNHSNVLTINAWNEWTEGSYLEPDTTYGFGYLEAIQRVFGQPED